MRPGENNRPERANPALELGGKPNPEVRKTPHGPPPVAPSRKEKGHARVVGHGRSVEAAGTQPASVSPLPAVAQA